MQSSRTAEATRDAPIRETTAPRPRWRPNLDRAWSEAAHFQVGDKPGRNEPGTGEVNYKNVFAQIHKKGFTGIVGMEHGKSAGGKEGERKLIEAYRQADSF